jgi:hypothetical protein
MWYVACTQSHWTTKEVPMEQSSSTGIMAVMVVALVAIVVVFLLVSGVLTPQDGGGGIDIKLP